MVNSAVTAAGRQRRSVPLEASSGPARIAWEPADPDLGPEELILAAESASEVWQALESLPPEQRAATILRYYLELPEAEAADRLGTPPGTVKSRLSTARAKMRELLDPDGERRARR